MSSSTQEAKSYASDNGISYKEVVDAIKDGVLSGYEENGYWFVRTGYNDEIEQKANITVADYAKENELDVAFVLGEIAKGVRNGYHDNGIWYIGKQQREDNRRKNLLHSTEEKKGRLDLIVGSFILLSIVGYVGFTVWSQFNVDDKQTKIRPVISPLEKYTEQITECFSVTTKWAKWDVEIDKKSVHKMKDTYDLYKRKSIFEDYDQDSYLNEPPALQRGSTRLSFSAKFQNGLGSTQTKTLYCDIEGNKVKYVWMGKLTLN